MLHTRKDGVSLPVAVVGTVAIQLPTLATQPAYSTIVVTPGVLSLDAVMVFPNRGNSAAYGFASGGTSVVVAAAEASDGSIIVYFNNPGVSTGYVDRTYTYIAAR